MAISYSLNLEITLNLRKESHCSRGFYRFDTWRYQWEHITKKHVIYKNNIVNYDIWYTPDLENVYTFLKDFEKYDKALGDSAKMTVHFVTYPHIMYDPNSNTPKEDCLGSGLYCIRPGKLGITDGSVIVMESIKQKCIYNNAVQKNKMDMSSL